MVDKVDYAVIGVSALDRDGDLLDFDLAEVRVSKAIIRQSRRSFLVCDHSKLDRSAPARLASLAEIGTLFTDRPLPEALQRRCEAGRGPGVPELLCRVLPGLPGRQHNNNLPDPGHPRPA